MRREYSIYKTLASLARQQVAMVLQPGNVWVIERAMPHTIDNEENLQTCMMRGWVEILHQSVPSASLKPDGRLSNVLPPGSTQTIYRLTDSGWNAIHRAHMMTLFGLVIALIGALATLLTTQS